MIIARRLALAVVLAIVAKDSVTRPLLVLLVLLLSLALHQHFHPFGGQLEHFMEALAHYTILVSYATGLLYTMYYYKDKYEDPHFVPLEWFTVALNLCVTFVFLCVLMLPVLTKAVQWYSQRRSLQ